MFSIYGVDGRVFHNTLEELYKVTPAKQNAALLRTRSDTLDTQTHTYTPAARRHTPNKTSLDAYRNQLNISPKEELNHAYEIMQEDFIRLPENMAAIEAIKLMQDKKIDELPVIDENNRIIGLFSYQTVLTTLLEQELELTAIKSTAVKGYISEQVITAEPVTSIRRVAQAMAKYDLKIIPIVDAFDALVGLISNRDLAEAVAKEPPLSIWT